VLICGILSTLFSQLRNSYADFLTARQEARLPHACIEGARSVATENERLGRSLAPKE